MQSVLRKATRRLPGPHRRLARSAAATPKDLGEYDYVIVGGGSAGCVLANRLSADPSKTVVMLEAGGSDMYHWVQIPVGYIYTMRYPQDRTNWGFRTCEQPGLNGRFIFYPRGKLLGGSGSINGMIAMRGQAEDYDGWAAALEDDSWNWKSMRPHFERQMKYTAATPVLADGSMLGTDGPLEVTRQAMSWRVLDQWADACEKVELPRRTHFIDSQTAGVGYFEVTQTQLGAVLGALSDASGPRRGGVRLSPYRAFVTPILKARPNLTILRGIHASKLKLERDESVGGRLRCTGVEVWQRDTLEGVASYLRAIAVDLGLIKSRKDSTAEKRADVACTIRARREVVLAAGAVGSPHLLQCSGIGDDALLRAHNVQTRVDLPGVGRNLQDHLQIRAVFRLADGVDTLNSRLNSHWGMAQAAAEYVLRQSGPLSMAPSQLGVFAHSSEEVRTPDLQWHVQPLSLDSWEDPLHRWNGLTASVCHLRPTSRGSIELTTPDTRDAPRIDPNYLSTEADRAVAAAAMRWTRRIAAQLAPELRAQEHVPGAHLTTDAELARAAGDIGTSIFHPAGTTKMGRDGEPGAVLNSRLQVRDGTRSGVIGGLRVADCGVMPTITSGNTNLPTYAIAEKASRIILREE